MPCLACAATRYYRDSKHKAGANGASDGKQDEPISKANQVDGEELLKQAEENAGIDEVRPSGYSREIR
jgi:hypothetical protein